jgi:hypothetical protein
MGCGEAQPRVSAEQAEVQLVISQDNTSVVNKAWPSLCDNDLVLGPAGTDLLLSWC